MSDSPGRRDAAPIDNYRTLTTVSDVPAGLWTGYSKFVLSTTSLSSIGFGARVLANLLRSICILAGLILVWALYRLQIRRIKRNIAVRLNEQSERRALVACERLESLLQTVNGGRMVADDALEHMDDPGRVRPALEHLSSWLGMAAEDARAALDSLGCSNE